MPKCTARKFKTSQSARFHAPQGPHVRVPPTKPHGATPTSAAAPASSARPFLVWINKVGTIELPIRTERRRAKIDTRPHAPKGHGDAGRQAGPRALTSAEARAVSISTAAAALPHAVRRCSRHDVTRARRRRRRHHARTRAPLRAPRVSRLSRVAEHGRPRRRTFPTRRTRASPGRRRVREYI